MSNLFINNNSGKQYRFELTDKHYYDFYIWNEQHRGNSDDTDCKVAEIDPNIDGCIGEDNKIYSTITWDYAVNTGIELPDWGFCSVDNGFTEYNPETDNLVDIFTGTTLEIPEDDKRFFMKPVDGFFYDIDYSYSIEEENNKKFFSLEGGFLQGFYKLYTGVNSDTIKYQTLPNRPERAWTWEFILRPRHIEKENTLNYFFPENYGFFFYQGLRAENKWWYYSNKLNLDKLEQLKQTIQQQEDYFLEDYLDVEELSKNKSIFEILQTSSGILLNTPNIIEFKSDNKYLLFNRTKCGYRTNNPPDFDEFIVSYQKKNPNLNYYLLFNRTKNGLTTNDVEPTKGSCVINMCQELDCNPYLRYNLFDKPKQNFPDLLQDIDIYDNTIDINKDIYNNNIGFRITETGQIGYRYLIQNCDEDKDINPVKSIEEYSKENVVQYNKWNYIVIRFIFNPTITNPECSNQPARKGKLYFYNNGKLIFVSQTVDEPMFKELNEYWEKQLGVPYNISLGGGSQGLLETILSDNPLDYDRYVFPIEKYFTGTLYGDIMSFKINNCDIGFNNIINNYNYLKEKMNLH